MLNLFNRKYYRAGRYGYSAVDYNGGTVESGITKKQAESLIGAMANAVNHFCRMNQLATLLADLEEIKPSLKRMKSPAAKRILSWIDEHSKTPIDSYDGDVTVYLSLDNERYDRESAARKAEYARGA